MALKDYVALARPHQWIKNAFVAAPLFFTNELLADGAAVSRVIAGVAVFCALSSAVYVLNDWMDREADRRHPVKRTRPIAAGRVNETAALGAAAVGVALAMAAAVALSSGAASSGAAGSGAPPAFWAICAAYLANNLAYSVMGLKNYAILDVLSIAFGFILRLMAGASLAGVAPSAWIVICTGLLALFIAVAKRRDDLVQALDTQHRRSLSGYNKAFLDAVMTTLSGALVVSYCVYTTDQASMDRLGSDQLYFTAPFVVAGVMRYLQITFVEERSGSPTRLAVSDPFLVAAILGWTAAFAIILYT